VHQVCQLSELEAANSPDNLSGHLEALLEVFSQPSCVAGRRARAAAGSFPRLLI
jgi:hypothetical protein